ncbi:MAG: protein kinase [archaeon]|nr:protein kinase [archaeon]
MGKTLLEEQRKEAREERPLNSNNNSISPLAELSQKTKLIIKSSNPIGKGGYSKVYDVFSPNKVNEFAVKIIEIPKEVREKRTEKKFKLKYELFKSLAEQDCINSISLKHKNIIQAYSIVELKNDNYAIVMQKANGSLLGVTSQFYANNLLSTVSSNKMFKHMNENIARYLCNDILDGLFYLFTVDFVHFDLKPDNILIYNNTLKLADFTLSKCVSTNGENAEKSFKFSGLGSKSYLPPECYDPKKEIKNKNANKIDAFGFGCILFRILFNKFVIDRFEETTLEKRKEECEEYINNSISYISNNPFSEYISKETKEFLAGALNPDAEKRSSIYELATNDWRYVRKEENKHIQDINDDDYKKLLIELEKGPYMKKPSRRTKFIRRRIRCQS